MNANRNLMTARMSTGGSTQPRRLSTTSALGLLRTSAENNRDLADAFQLKALVTETRLARALERIESMREQIEVYRDTITDMEEEIRELRSLNSK